MARLKYDEERFSKVQVCGIECEFSDMRIDRGSIPEGKFMYEVAGDDESGIEPVRINLGILVNFFGTLISDVPFPLGKDGVLWTDDSDFVWLESKI